ncbi:MAG TPA: mannose-1-phosphate guanylyltransferase/mannose-6-phosphate isomerase [Blastocatellia bacterium]|nr:mannose-1-phosphate guanylyltransferase/mannose-6-phosphate isomerase [Blastocatellia bacterium]
MRQVLPFILSGGVGTRLWPLSREAYPKQFHRLTGSESLFQLTCRRLSGPLFGELSVLSNHRYRFILAEQLEEIGAGPASLVLEPAGRNTAPAACIAALMAEQIEPEALVLLAPSDHMIPDAEAFARTVESGVAAAEAGAVVTFGIVPDSPHTGYGYIETEAANGAALKVRRFVEKPSREAAEQFLDSGQFYWNGGIFLFKARTMLDLLKTHAPSILEGCQSSLAEVRTDLGFRVLNGAYSSVPCISLDYAIAEKADNLMCVPLATSWSDVGSWSSLWNFMDKDARGNAVSGSGQIIIEDTSDSFVFSDDGCVALVGVENLVVIAMQDAVLVASKDHAEGIQQVVDRLKGLGCDLATEHNRVHRPWGWYQSLNRGDRYQVKCIMVKPGGRLSLQSHYHRSEHWVVVTGTLEVTRGETTEMLSENQSTYIPIGQKHRLANPGKIPAFLIEVQSGTYLNEDDIVRYDDVYHRGSGD